MDQSDRFLASTDLDVAATGSCSLWSEPDRVPPHQSLAPCGERIACLLGSSMADGIGLAQRGGGGFVRPASAPRRIGRLGGGEERSAEHVFRLGGAWRLQCLRTSAGADALPPRPCRLHLQPVSQANDGHVARHSVAFGLLASATIRGIEHERRRRKRGRRGEGERGRKKRLAWFLSLYRSLTLPAPRDGASAEHSLAFPGKVAVSDHCGSHGLDDHSNGKENRRIGRAE